MAVNEVQFANFVCKFGERPMRTFLQEIILPAFTDDALTRSYGEDTYFHFYDVRLAQLGRSSHAEPAVFGRFIKNTRISRDQYFDSKRGLVKDHRELRSSPSAFFVLLVRNHRLIYFSETAGAPEMSSFATTARRFVIDKYEAHINRLYEASQEERANDPRPGEPRTTKRALQSAIPRPRVDVITLSDPTDIESFLNRYATLRRMEFKVIDTNDEPDAGELFERIRKTFDGLHSTQTKLVSSNPKGLNIEAAKTITKEATQSGYQEVRFNGKDDDGNRLIGDNENFALRASMEEPPADDKDKAQALLDQFNRLKREGVIVVNDAAPENLTPDQRQLFDE